MGLAASQARLVFLTFESNNISYDMQRLAMQRLRMASKSEKIAGNYDRAMDTVCYTTAWQANGNPDVNHMALTYNTLMTPGTNFGKQFLLTDSSGKVILSDDYCTKLGLQGNSGNAGTLPITLNQFLQNIMGITSDQAVQYISETSNSSSTTPNASISVMDFLNQSTIELDQTIINAANGLGGVNSHLVNSNMSWLAMYNNNLDVLVQYGSGNSNYGDGDVDKYITGFEALLNQFFDDIKSCLGFNNNATEALEYAYAQTRAQFVGNLSDTSVSSDTDTVKKWLKNAHASGDNVIVAGHEHDTATQWDDLLQGARVNVKNMIDCFFTFYQMKLDEQNGINDGRYLICNKREESSYADITNMTIYAADPISINTSKQQEANFYINLYNAVTNGWVRTSNIENMSESEFETKLLEGTYKLKVLNGTSWSDYSASSLQNQGSEVWVEDEEATSAAHKKAEREYDREKVKLHNAESRLDMNQQQLSTRYNAVTTEIDSVKKLIDDNIKRNFKLFQG